MAFCVKHLRTRFSAGGVKVNDNAVDIMDELSTFQLYILLITKVICQYISEMFYLAMPYELLITENHTARFKPQPF